jgi:hypothetical protein
MTAGAEVARRRNLDQSGIFPSWQSAIDWNHSSMS